MTPITVEMRTINAATKAVVEAIHCSVCQWEQQSQDAIQEGNLTSALMYKNWAFAADLMAKTAATSLSNLMIDSYDRRQTENIISIPLETKELTTLPAS